MVDVSCSASQCGYARSAVKGTGRSAAPPRPRRRLARGPRGERCGAAAAGVAGEPAGREGRPVSRRSAPLVGGHDGPRRPAAPSAPPPRRRAGSDRPPAGRPPARPPGRSPHRRRSPAAGVGVPGAEAPETAAPNETATIMTSRITVDGDPIMGDDSASEQKSSTPIPLRLRDPGQIARNSAIKTAGHHTTAVLLMNKQRPLRGPCLFTRNFVRHPRSE